MPKRSEHMVFVNALRQCLGLDPLYAEAPSAPWWAPYIGTGSRHVIPARSSDQQSGSKANGNHAAVTARQRSREA